MTTVTIGGINIGGYVLPPTVRQQVRSESIAYALDGSVLKDRIGTAKLAMTLQFGLMPIMTWQALKAVLAAASFQVVFSDTEGWTKTFHCASELPTPYIVSPESTNATVGGFSLEIEEV